MKYPALRVSIILQADIHTVTTHLIALLVGHRFDAVMDFLTYTPEDIERGISLFRDKTDQFVTNRVVFDNSKIKHFVPEFNCEVDWAAGLHNTLTWFEVHP